jgi:hypothetical protein
MLQPWRFLPIDTLSNSIEHESLTSMGSCKFVRLTALTRTFAQATLLCDLYPLFSAWPPRRMTRCTRAALEDCGEKSQPRIPRASGG